MFNIGRLVCFVIRHSCESQRTGKIINIWEAGEPKKQCRFPRTGIASTDGALGCVLVIVDAKSEACCSVSATAPIVFRYCLGCLSNAIQERSLRCASCRVVTGLSIDLVISVKMSTSRVMVIHSCMAARLVRSSSWRKARMDSPSHILSDSNAIGSRSVLPLTVKGFGHPGQRN
jgi:hypothetical protein